MVSPDSLRFLLAQKYDLESLSNKFAGQSAVLSVALVKEM